jgi:hypothetical protein
MHQGLSMCYQEMPSECDLAYADFLSLDISMLKLFESFLEATPQLTLVLAIVLQNGQAEYYQCECWAQGCHFCRLFSPLQVFSLLGGKKKKKEGA